MVQRYGDFLIHEVQVVKRCRTNCENRIFLSFYLENRVIFAIFAQKYKQDEEAID